MKNFIFKSSQDSDLQKLFQKLDIIQAEQRHARYDLQQLDKRMIILVKGMAILVSTPEEDLDLNVTEDSRDSD